MLEHEYWSTGVNDAFVFLLLFLCFIFGCYFTGVINVLGEWIRGRRNNDNHRLRRWIHTFNNKQLVAFILLLFSVIVGVEYSIPLVCTAANHGYSRVNQGFTAATNSVNANIYSFVSPVDVNTTPSFYGDGDTGAIAEGFRGHLRKHDGNKYYPNPSPADSSEQRELISSPTNNVIIIQPNKSNNQHLVIDQYPYYGPLGKEMEETADKLNHYSGVSIIPDDVEQDDPSLVLILRGVDPNGEGNEGGMINNSGGNGGGGGGGGDGGGGGGGRRKYLVRMFNMNDV